MMTTIATSFNVGYYTPVSTPWYVFTLIAILLTALASFAAGTNILMNQPYEQKRIDIPMGTILLAVGAIFISLFMINVNKPGEAILEYSNSVNQKAEETYNVSDIQETGINYDAPCQKDRGTQTAPVQFFDNNGNLNEGKLVFRPQGDNECEVTLYRKSDSNSYFPMEA